MILIHVHIFLVFKLLGNMALWDGLITQDVLKELMLDKLLNRYLMMTLLNESDAKHIIQKSKKVMVLSKALKALKA